MKKQYNNILVFLLIIIISLILNSCKDCEDNPTQGSTIIYKSDGRTVKQGDISPIALDISGDGQVDFTIFAELTANSKGDRLYFGINPIGANLIKSGPTIDENFLSMGLLIAETQGEIINYDLEDEQQWTPNHSALVIRNTFTNGNMSYEGEWADTEHIVGIQHNLSGNIHFGWLRLKFDKATEIMHLIDYAYNSEANQPIKAGSSE